MVRQADYDVIVRQMLAWRALAVLSATKQRGAKDEVEQTLVLESFMQVPDQKRVDDLVERAKKAAVKEGWLRPERKV